MSKGGKGSRARTKERRKRQRQQQKTSRQEQYLKWRDLGINQKSARAKANKKRAAQIRVTSHPQGQCGNVGCIPCNGINFKPFLKSGKPVGMPQWMWMRWRKAA